MQNQGVSASYLLTKLLIVQNESESAFYTLHTSVSCMGVHACTSCLQGVLTSMEWNLTTAAKGGRHWHVAQRRDHAPYFCTTMHKMFSYSDSSLTLLLVWLGPPAAAGQQQTLAFFVLQGSHVYHKSMQHIILKRQQKILGQYKFGSSSLSTEWQCYILT